ncbi:MAG: hypothetical protein AB1758_16500, partial [Candidatus Eremiobacterota bacterium]
MKLPLPAAAPDAPQRLQELVREASARLAGDAPASALPLVEQALELLLSYFAGATVGSLIQSGAADEDLASLARGPAGPRELAELLRRAYASLRSRTDDPFQKDLTEVFFAASKLSAGKSAPRRHSRWLGLSEPPLGRGPGQGHLAVEEGVALLAAWLRASERFFAAWKASYRQNGACEVHVTLQKASVSFELVPPLRIAEGIPPAARPEL